jgi:hypothetical protein
VKEKAKPIDGLGPHEMKKISSAVRQVWYRCKARKEAVKRCTETDGFLRCEICGVITPKINIDHIVPVGSLLDNFIERLFCPSIGLQGLCPPCHKEKTKAERRLTRALK